MSEYAMKNEKLRDGDLDLCAAFRAARGAGPDRTISSLGLGWFAEFSRNHHGLSREESSDLAARVFFHEKPEHAVLYDFLAASQPADQMDAVKHLQDTLKMDERAAMRIVNESSFGADYAIHDRDWKLRLRNRGEDVGYWP